MTKMPTKLLFLILGFLLIAPLTSVNAQGSDGFADRIRTEIERTDEIIEKAKEAVQASQSPVAGMALEFAQQLQNHAWDDFHGKRYQGAASFTKQAREKAYNAISLSRQTTENDDNVLRRLERLEEWQARARERLAEVDDPRLEALMEQTRENVRQAWEFYREKQYRPAVKLIQQVEKTLNKLIQAANRQHNGEENYQKRWQYMNEDMTRAEEAVAGCEIPQAQQQMEQAKMQLRLAEEMSDKGRYEQAVKALQRAEKLMRQAASACANLSNLENRLERLTHMADDLAEKIPVGDETNSSLLEAARTQLDLAAEYISNDDTAGATAALRAAMMSLQLIQKNLSGS